MTAHKVKAAVEVGHGLVVVECACGWSSPLLTSKTAANERYAAHKRAHVDEVLPESVTGSRLEA